MRQGATCVAIGFSRVCRASPRGRTTGGPLFKPNLPRIHETPYRRLDSDKGLLKGGFKIRAQEIYCPDEVPKSLATACLTFR